MLDMILKSPRLFENSHLLPNYLPRDLYQIYVYVSNTERERERKSPRAYKVMIIIKDEKE
jgi:hypothetical protein